MTIPMKNYPKMKEKLYISYQITCQIFYTQSKAVTLANELLWGHT